MMERFPKRILLATDGSGCAEAAGRVAVDLANRSGAELDVVHAYEFVPAREYAGVALRLRSPAEFTQQGPEVLAGPGARRPRRPGCAPPRSSPSRGRRSSTSRWPGSARWAARSPTRGCAWA